MNIVATIQTNYNGWTVEIDGEGYTSLGDKIEETLPEITAKYCDEDGECYRVPEAKIRKAVSKIVNQKHELTIEYDGNSS